MGFRWNDARHSHAQRSAPGPKGSALDQFRKLDGFTYFIDTAGRPSDSLGEGGHYQLWRTDGTEAGTTLLSDMTQYPESTTYLRMTVASDKILIEQLNTGDSHENVVKTLVVDPAIF